MLVKIRKYIVNPVNRPWVFFGLFYLFLAGVFFVVMSITAREVITQQTFKRELTVVRSGTNSVESFLTLFGQSLTILTAGDLNQPRLEGFVESWQGTPIAGVIVTDANGVVIANANRLGQPDLGGSVADRGYFAWAKNAEDGYYVSRAMVSRLGASKDKYIVVVAAPIVEAGQFRGVLAASIILEELAAGYLDPLKATAETRFYLVDQETGDVILSPWPKLVGVNYFDYLEDHPYPGSSETSEALKGALASPQDGQLTVTLPNEVTGKLTPFLVAHAPVFYNSQDSNRWWTLVMAKPTDAIAPVLAPFYSRQIAVAAVGLLALVILAARLAPPRKV